MPAALLVSCMLGSALFWLFRVLCRRTYLQTTCSRSSVCIDTNPLGPVFASWVMFLTV